MGRSLVILLTFVAAFANAQNDPLFEEAIDVYREEIVVFDSILDDYSAHDVALNVLSNEKVIHFYNETDQSPEIIASLEKSGCEIVIVDKAWVDSVRILPVFSPSRHPSEIKFSGAFLFVLERYDDFCWGIYEKGHRKQYAINDLWTFHGKRSPKSLRLKMNGNAYHWDKYGVDLELTFRDSANLKDYWNDGVNFTVYLSKFGLKKRQFYDRENQNVTFVTRGNKIRYYQLFKGSYFGDAEKRKPIGNYRKLIIK